MFAAEIMRFFPLHGFGDSLIRVPDVCFWTYVLEWKEADSVVHFRYIERGQ